MRVRPCGRIFASRRFWHTPEDNHTIFRAPNQTRGRGAVDKDGRGRLGAYACGVPGLPAPARPESQGRSPLPRGASFLHRRERSLARSTGTLRSLEQRVETLRSLEQGRRLRGLFRHARSHESTAHLLQMFDSTVVRAHVSAAGAKGGRKARRSAARAAASPRKSTQNRTPPATSSPST